MKSNETLLKNVLKKTVFPVVSDKFVVPKVWLQSSPVFGGHKKPSFYLINNNKATISLASCMSHS